MRKSDRKTKIRNNISSRNAYRRNISRREKRKGRKKNKKPFRLRKTELKCPEIFSLDSNFNGVVRTLVEIRHQGNIRSNKPSEQAIILLQNIRQLSPAAALMLAAEIYRWINIPSSRVLKAANPSEWDSQVRKLLGDMGFFKLLGLSNLEQVNADDNDIRYVKFKTGNKSDGSLADDFIKNTLEPTVGEIPKGKFLYGAVTEAMTNVAQHAYNKNNSVPNWWLSASSHPSKREVTIMVYDQGAGIPRTLPRKIMEKLEGQLYDNDAKLIEAAHKFSRTKSRQKHRGYGLRANIRKYFDVLEV